MTTAATNIGARYTTTAIALHWLIAALIVGGFTLGLSMVGLPLSRQKLQWYAWHKWIGITVFLLSCARLAWRWGHHPPPAPRAMPRWQVRAARWAHGLLYALLLVIPLTGWLFSSASGVQVVYLGLVPLARSPAQGQGAGWGIEGMPRRVELHAPGACLYACRGGTQTPFR